MWGENKQWCEPALPVRLCQNLLNHQRVLAVEAGCLHLGVLALRQSASAQKVVGVTMRVRPKLPRCSSPAR